MSKEPSKVVAVQAIADRYGVTKSRVDYAIGQLDLKPQACHGGVRVFLESDVLAIVAQVNKNRGPLAALRDDGEQAATAGEAK